MLYTALMFGLTDLQKYYVCVIILCIWNIYTLKPLNKGHVGDNIINSHALSLVERLSSFWRFKLYCDYREFNRIFGSHELTVLCREVYNIQCPFLGVGSFTVVCIHVHTKSSSLAIQW